METITLSVPQLGYVFYLMIASFFLSMAITPFWTHVLYKYKLWKRIRNTALTGEKATVYASLHQKKAKTPTMGGVIIWGSVFLITLFLNLDRRETWLPLFALVAAGLIGLVDDFFNIFGFGPHGGGLRFRHKLVWYILISVLGAWWFYYKLGWTAIHIPGGNLFTLPYQWELGIWYIPLFILVLIGTSFAVNESDGLDGLAGGLLASSFAAYSIIALSQEKIMLAAFCASIVGALLTFLWFNIYPARFFMGDTGSMALGITLAVVAFLTNSVFVLPIIGFVFVLEGLSVIIQLASKKLRKGKKVFLSAPFHHHLEAIGWPETKVTMRFWVIGTALAVIGTVIALIGRG